jgi:DNA modification methylase
MNAQLDIIHHGDCIQVLNHVSDGSMDFVLTDPPYLASYKSRDGRTVPNDDNDAWLWPAFTQIYRVMAPDSFCVSFYGWPRADTFITAWRHAGFGLAGHITFPKRYTSRTGFLRGQHENAYLLTKGDPRRPDWPIGDVIDWTYSGNRLHPTQKPVSVLLPLVETFCPPEGIVLDPFAGSGSTLLAAKMLERRYVGIELDAKYHAIATRRMTGASPDIGEDF